MNLKGLLLSLLVLALFGSAIGLVWSRHEHRLLFAELSDLERNRDRLNVQYDRLQIEQATLADSRRIKRKAVARFGMRPPLAEEIIVVVP